MLRYILRRVAYIIPLLFGVTLITFLLFHTVGGNPCYQMLGRHITPEALAQCEKQNGFDRPLYIQYAGYLKEVATLDFGQSYSTKQQVSQIILDGVGPSLTITLPAFVIGNVAAIILGLLVAFFRAQMVDRVVVFFCVIGMSVTVLAYIIVGQYVLAYLMGLFPISGFEPGIAAIPYVALPILIWVVVGLGYDVRFYRTCILDESNQDYVRTARAKGLSHSKVFFKHVLKNALVPIITHLIIAVPFLITGSLLLENFFQIPGLGNAVILAINNSDFPVLKAMVFIGAVGFSVFQIITDICYAWVDPRVRLGA